MKLEYLIIILCFALILSCRTQSSTALESYNESDRIPIIIDTDANNELDDQHALAYSFFNSAVFDIKGVTVNHTSEGTVQNDYDEAQRVMILCKVWNKTPLLKGADSGRYRTLKYELSKRNHEGHEAVDFIIKMAHAQQDRPLILAPIGKLTNIALAIEKDPAIVSKVRIYWLGGNYYGKDGPDNEHNLIYDTEAYNSLIESGVKFTMVTVRYGALSGTDAVAVHVEDIKKTMPGLGPISDAVIGRHGDSFQNFGDYSVNLFTNYTDGTRPLFDMVVFAALKNPSWAKLKIISAPKLDGPHWSGTFEDRTITLLEYFDKNAILDDFFESMRHPILIDKYIPRNR